MNNRSEKRDGGGDGREMRRGLHIMYSKRRNEERAIAGQPQPNPHGSSPILM
jgi:hypothetical protein